MTLSSADPSPNPIFFFQTFELQDEAQVRALHEIMAPFLLRREKELVERNLPPKKEIIIEVEMTVRHHPLRHEQDVQ